MINTDEAKQHVETDEHHGSVQLGGRTIDIDFDKGTITGAGDVPIAIPKTTKNVEIESIKGKLTINADGAEVYPKK